MRDSPIYPDIKKVLEATDKPVPYHYYTATIHTVEYDMEALAVVHIEFDNDYANNIGQYLYVDLIYPTGDVNRYIVPNRNNLEITLEKTAQGITTNKRYKLVLKEVDVNTTSGYTQNLTTSEMNTQSLTKLSGQCLNRSLEVMRTVDMSGIYRDQSPEAVMMLAFTNIMSKYRSVDGPLVQVMDVVPPDNTRVYDHIIIPSGTKAIDIPFYLQEVVCGIYNTGVGVYVRDVDDKSITSIYPLYNHNMDRGDTPILNIFSTGSMRFEFSENTYIVDGDDINVLVSENKIHVDTGDNAYMNDAVGFTVRKAGRVVNNPSMTENGKSENITEDTNTSVRSKDRSDGIMYKKHIPATDNMYHERSKFTQQAGSFLQATWNSSDDTLLFPAMRVRYAYVRNNEVVVLKGVLHGFYSLYSAAAKKTNTKLMVFLEKDQNVID